MAPAVLVVGAGVIGLGCALRLARGGARVTLIDRDEPGRGTSYGNAGHIATESVFPLASLEVLGGSLRYLLDPSSPLRIHPGYALEIAPWLARFAWAARPSAFAAGTRALASLQRTARADIVDLLAMAHAGRLVHTDGHLVIVEKPESFEASKMEVGKLREHGIDIEWLPEAAVKALVPELAPRIEGAWKYTGTGHVDDPYAMSQALASGLVEGGGEIVRGEVTRVECSGERCRVTDTSGQMIEGTHLVIACGAWSKPLAAQLGYSVPLDTERGYHVTLPTASPAFRIPVSSFERKVIMTPMSCGLRMTGTVEFGGLTLPPDPRRFALLEGHLRALVPSLPTEGLTTWMGYRPSLPDHLPVLGRIPDGRNVFFAFGHQHLGLTLSGVTARIVAGEVLGSPHGVDLTPFSPLRFQ